MITMEMITKPMLDDVSKCWSIPANIIKELIEDGEVYVFDLKGIIQFYSEIGYENDFLHCEYKLEIDLLFKDVVKSNNLFFMAPEWGHEKLKESVVSEILKEQIYKRIFS